MHIHWCIKKANDLGFLEVSKGIIYLAFILGLAYKEMTFGSGTTELSPRGG